MTSLEKFISKAEVLVEAYPYIRAFAGKIILVKTGGSVMENDRAHREMVLGNIAFMRCVGMQPVIVHGGGPAISKHLKEKNIRSEFRAGLRVTSPEALQEIQYVINNRINPEYVRILQNLGIDATGIPGEEIIIAGKKVVYDESGNAVDLGLVGEPLNVKKGRIVSLLEQGVIPIITSLGRSISGQVYNVNADSTAAAVARALNARKLVYLSDVPGVLSNPDDPKTLIPELSIGGAQLLIGKGVVRGGMLPKVESAIETLKVGVENVHFISGDLKHALLLELFTDRGVGTIFIR